MDFKEPGDIVYVLGADTRRTRVQRIPRRVRPTRPDHVPTVRPEEAWPLYQALAKATDQRLVRSCHDLSDGGLAVSLAESAFAGGLGAEVDLSLVPLARIDGSRRFHPVLGKRLRGLS